MNIFSSEKFPRKILNWGLVPCRGKLLIPPFLFIIFRNFTNEMLDSSLKWPMPMNLSKDTNRNTIQVEKLQNELATQRTEMSAERHRLQQEKLSLVQQEQMLKQRLDNTIEQLQEALQTQQDLCKELAQAQQRIQRVNDGYQLLQQEKLGLASANETLRQQLLTSSLSSADLEPSTNRTTPERSTGKWQSTGTGLCT